METRGSKVIFITTKNLEYIRNVQELRLLKKQYNEVVCIGSNTSKYITRLIYIYWKIFFTSFRGKPDIFIGFAPQLVLPFWKWKFRNQHIKIDFFISVYDTMVCDRQKIPDRSILAKLAHYLDEITLKWADEVIGDTRAHADYFSKEFQIPMDKFRVLYLEADKRIYYPRFREKRIEWKEFYIVLYFGSVLPLQGVPVVVEAINCLRESRDIFFWMIGPLGDLAGKLRNQNVRLDDWMPQEELADAIAMADLCLAGHFNVNIDKADRTIPGKAYIYEQMHKPMILGDTRANHEVFDEDDLHYFVERGSGVKLAEKILEVKERYERCFD